MAATQYSLIIPVYRNEETIPALLDAVAGLAVALAGRMEAVFVVDGSPDRSYDLLVEGLGTRAFPAEVVQHSRNFGSFAAIRTGLAVGQGPFFAVMAADLQEPPELILDFFQRPVCRTPRD